MQPGLKDLTAPAGADIGEAKPRENCPLGFASLSFPVKEAI
jgi:hypothetical protein